MTFYHVNARMNVYNIVNFILTLQNLKKTPQAQTDAILQHEINRLTSENVVGLFSIFKRIIIFDCFN